MSSQRTYSNMVSQATPVTCWEEGRIVGMRVTEVGGGLNGGLAEDHSTVEEGQQAGRQAGVPRSQNSQAGGEIWMGGWMLWTRKQGGWGDRTKDRYGE